METVARPDKGNNVVVLDRDRYLTSIVNLIFDPSQKIIFRLEDKLNRFLAKLKSIGATSEKKKQDLYASGYGHGNLYGLSKVQKTKFIVDFLMRLFF